MERWHDRVALVTGASVGIGAAICRELAKHGMKVIGCARSVEKIKAIAQEPSMKTYPGTLHAIKCDLRKESEIFAMFAEIREKFGRLDVCINNAGLSTSASLLAGNIEEWRTMLDVNVMALCICTKEAIKIMRENSIDDGQIIQISSMSGHRIPSADASFYSGTKFMVKALTECLRRELKALNSHIRVASISPGMVETQFIYNMNKEFIDKVKSVYESMDCLQSQDIAAIVTSILQMPPHVDINDVLVRPIDQAV